MHFYKTKDNKGWLSLRQPLIQKTVQPEPTEVDEAGQPIIPEPIPQFNKDGTPILLDPDTLEVRDYVEITEEQWNAHIAEMEQAQAEADRIFNLPENVAKRAKQAEIADLKAHLAETDYQAIKFAEGWITAEDYAVMKAQRQAWRDRINELEAELA